MDDIVYGDDILMLSISSPVIMRIFSTTINVMTTACPSISIVVSLLGQAYSFSVHTPLLKVRSFIRGRCDYHGRGRILTPVPTDIKNIKSLFCVSSPFFLFFCFLLLFKKNCHIITRHNNYASRIFLSIS